MKKNVYFTAGALLISLCMSAQAATYPGNGNSGWGGPVGLGTLDLSDDGTTLNLTLNRGTGDLNDALVIYIDSVAGGFSDTSGFTDVGDGARKAISGFDGANRSTMTFASGFLPDYAISIEGGYASLFTLVNAGSFNWNTGAGQSGNSSATFSLSFPLASIGVTVGDSFDLFGTYLSGSGYRSPEAIAGDATGTDGWNPFTQTSFVTYMVPEPSTLALLCLPGLAVLFHIRRRR